MCGQLYAEIDEALNTWAEQGRHCSQRGLSLVEQNLGKAVSADFQHGHQNALPIRQICSQM